MLRHLFRLTLLSIRGVEMNMQIKKMLIKLKHSECCWLLLLFLLTAVGWLPLILSPGRCGNLGDWDMFLAFYEAVRKSIVEYGQFPFWNPWHFGGVPLFANPQVAVIGLETPFIVLFGTVYGLNLAIFTYVLLGAAGVWLLLGDYTRHPVSRFWGSLIFVLAGALALHIAAGHPVMIPIVFLPWLLYFLRRLPESRRDAVWFGFVAGMLINHSMHYVSLSVSAFIGIYTLYLGIKHFKSSRFQLHLLLAVLIFTATAAYRFSATFQLLRDFPRAIGMRADVAYHHYLTALLYPGQSLFTFPGILKDYWGWFEIGCYVGVVAMGIFIISLVREVKWWHWGFLISSLLTLNSSCYWLPGYWLREIPPFTSYFCITRWRFLTVFFIAIGAARGFDWLYDEYHKKSMRLRLYLLLIVSVVGLLYNQHYNWLQITWTSENEMLKNVHQESSSILTVNNHHYSRYASVHKNLAQLFAYEPLFGYSREYKNKRFYHGHQFYAGEFYPVKGEFADILWTPNYLEIFCVKPGAILINQNPGNYWRTADGQQLFSQLKAFEVNEHFLLPMREQGKFVLQLYPPWHWAALGISVGALAAALLLMWLLKRFIDQRQTD